MRIVFCLPQWTGEYSLFGHFAKRNSTWPSLSLCVLAAACEQTGHEAHIVDAEALRLNATKAAATILSLEPDVIGFPAYTPFAHLSADVARIIKSINPEIPILIGGPHVTITKEEALLDCYDFAFMGESERSLPEFLDKFPNVETVKGIIYRTKSGEIKNNGEAWLRETAMRKDELGGRYPLDEIPLPARHLLDMRRYRLGTRDGRRHFTSLQTARGCPWR